MWTAIGLYFGIISIVFHNNLYLAISIMLLYVGLVASKKRKDVNGEN